jgi:hypothetical protein
MLVKPNSSVTTRRFGSILVRHIFNNDGFTINGRHIDENNKRLDVTEEHTTPIVSVE